MEWLLAVPFVLIGFEFDRVARYINAMKGDIEELKDQVRSLRQRIEYLENRD